MKRLLLPLLLSLALPASARVDPGIHEMCLKAQDYKGCIEGNNKKSSKKRRGYNKTLKRCLAEVRKDRKNKKLLSTSKEETNLACENLANVEYEKLEKYYQNKFITNKETNEEYKLIDVFGTYFLESSISFKNRNWNKMYQLSLCGAENVYRMKNVDADDVWGIYGYCDILVNWSRVVNGNILFVPQNNGYSWDYAIKEGSAKQAKIRNQYGRYISFRGRTLNEYAGTSGYTIPGTPGYINCSWGSSGSWGGYGQGGGYSGGGGCYGEEGTDPIKVEGKAGGVESNSYDYLLDCQDKTFDRKGDALNAERIAMKGWMDINEDPNAIFVSKTYCPVIDILPKGR